MCGRFTNTVSIKKLSERFGFPVPKGNFPPRFNIAPGQEVPVVVATPQKNLELMKWGLVPSWAKEEKIGYKMINARAETLNEKPSFKRAFQTRRCLVLADGFFEWKIMPRTKTKIPMRIVLLNREPFAFAGLWETWKKPQGSPLHSFTIVTTQANEKLKTIHDRMPVILHRDDEPTWLDPENSDVEELQSLLRPYDSDEVEAYPVSTRVNSPKNDSPECIKEAGK